MNEEKDIEVLVVERQKQQQPEVQENLKENQEKQEPQQQSKDDSAKIEECNQEEREQGQQSPKLGHDHHFALEREKRFSRAEVSSSPNPVHIKQIVDYLKPVQQAFLKHLEMNDSVSQFDVCVNDSQAGHVFDDIYDIGETLGEGGFAIVYQCTHRGNRKTYAVKELYEELYEEEGENLKLEIQALRKLSDGPYIVRLLDIFLEPNRTYMILEEMKGGDLLDRLGEKKVYSEHDARRVTRTLFEAVEYCHKKGYVHRDIKPENILLLSKDNDINIKLADFGCAKKIVGSNFCHTMVGSPEYVAPEVYTHENGYDQRCDLWSIGVVIYVLLGGYCPFEAPEHELPGVICEGEFEFHPAEWSQISESPKKLIKSLLKVDVTERCTIDGALSSPWLRRRDTVNALDFNSSFNDWLLKQQRASGRGLSHLGDSTSSFELSFSEIGISLEDVNDIANVTTGEQRNQNCDKENDNSNADLTEMNSLHFSEASHSNVARVSEDFALGFSVHSSQASAVAEAVVEAEEIARAKPETKGTVDSKADGIADNSTAASIASVSISNDAVVTDADCHVTVDATVDATVDETVDATVDTTIDASGGKNTNGIADNDVDENADANANEDADEDADEDANADANLITDSITHSSAGANEDVEPVAEGSADSVAGTNVDTEFDNSSNENTDFSSGSIPEASADVDKDIDENAESKPVDQADKPVGTANGSGNESAGTMDHGDSVDLNKEESVTVSNADCVAEVDIETFANNDVNVNVDLDKDDTDTNIHSRTETDRAATTVDDGRNDDTENNDAASMYVDATEWDGIDSLFNITDLPPEVGKGDEDRNSLFNESFVTCSSWE